MPYIILGCTFLAKGHVGKIVFGAIWLLLGIILIAGIVNVDYLTPAQEEPGLPEGLAVDILDMPLAGGREEDISAKGYTLDCDSAIVSSKGVVIVFSSIRTLDYTWRGSNPMLVLTSPESAVLSGETRNSSFPYQIESTETTVSPYLFASFEETDFVHQWVIGRALMDVT